MLLKTELFFQTSLNVDTRRCLWPVLGATSQRLGVWTGLHPPATALAPVSPENVDKVPHRTVRLLLRLFLSRRSWLVFVALSGTGASLLSLSPLSLCSSEEQYFTVAQHMDSGARLRDPGQVTPSQHPSVYHHL